MKIYTRTGDSGTTGLFGGDRVRKDHPRIEAYGTVDEANSAIGLARSLVDDLPDRIQELFVRIQNDLFVIGADLATPSNAKPVVPRVTEKHVKFLEDSIDSMESDLEPLTSFILPGGTPSGATIQLARTICRRAERATVFLAESADIDDTIAVYLNRLSDLLFVLGRWINHHHGVKEVEWHPE